MNIEPVDTRTNVLPNGRFDSGTRFWEFTGPSNGWALKGDTWENAPIQYMSLYQGAGITQQVAAPAPRSDRARYRLSFLYNNRSAETVTFSLRLLGSEDGLEIELPGTGAVAEEGERALSLTPYSALIEFDVTQEDIFDFVILSPREATRTKDFQIARIDFHLELDALELTAIVNDGQTHSITADPVLYLCHGATGDDAHRVSFKPATGSPWSGTEALLWSQDNPQERVVVTPAWGRNQLIDDQWEIDCPALVQDETLLFNLSIYSKYHADPYPIAVSLGHHRLVVETVLQPVYQPVIEYDQSVKLGVQVKSHYLGIPMAGVSVSWTRGSTELGVTETDGNGYAEFVFTPDTAGTLQIDARVDSPFYASGNIAGSFGVKAHAVDPLKAVRVKFPDMEPAPWGEKTGYPDRGATYRLSVLFADDSPLLNGNVCLAWEGKDPDELGVTASPDFLHPVLVNGTTLNWTLDCADLIDGEFNLRLVSADLLEPTVNNVMSLARHKLKIGDVREANRIPVVDEEDYVWCMLQVMSLSDEPIAGVPVEWESPRGTQRTFTGLDGWASVIDRPEEHGDYSLVARVNPREDGQVLSHEFAIQTLPTSAWKTASFKLDEIAIDRVGAGAVCRMGQQYVFHLMVEPGSLLIGKDVFLQWQDRASTGLIDIANMETPITVTPDGVQWNVDAKVAETSGVFDLQVMSSEMEPLDLAFRLLPEDLSAEVELLFDQMPKNWDVDVELFPCLGATHDLTVRPVNNLGGLHGLLLEAASTPALPSDWVIRPSLSERPAMTAGGVRYRCDFSEATTAAQRNWTISFSDVGAFTQPPAFGLQLAHNKVTGTPYEVATDPVLSKGESARLALRYVSAFTGQPANEVDVEWDDGGSSTSGAEGIAQRSYQPVAAGDNAVQALVRNAYDSTQVEHTFAVHAYENSPWDDLTVKNSRGEEQPWGEQTFFPRRADSLELELCAAPDSPLLGQTLTLGLSGAHELDTKVIFSPVLGVSQPLTDDGLPIRLVAGDQTDAAFDLQLSASRLLERSPLNAFSLGSYVPVDVAASTHEEMVADWGESLSFEVTLTNVLTGQPARNVQVTWDGTDEVIEPATTVTNFYGVARFSFVATVPGPGKLTARAVGTTQVITFDYLVHEACRIDSLTSDKLEGFPGETLNVEVAVVSVATDQPVEGVRVDWYLKGVVSEPVFTDAQGKALIVFELPTRIGSYTLSASVRGERGWESDWLSVRVLGTQDSWWQEFTLLLGDEPIIGAGYIREVKLPALSDHFSYLKLKAKKDSSLIGQASVHINGDPGVSLGVHFSPGFLQQRPITKDELEWAISTVTGAYGNFTLWFYVPGLPDLELQASTIAPS